MDKYELGVKVEQIRKLAKQKDYAAAAKIADTIDVLRVKDNKILALFADVYEGSGRYEQAKEILIEAYERTSLGRQLAYRLVKLCVKSGNISEAEEFYQDFIKVSPRDSSKYILQYELAVAKGTSIEKRISIIETYLSDEMDEKWAFELAKLYHKSGQKDKCVKQCDDIILWFNDGKYVDKALELKMRYAPLTKSQQAKYEASWMAKAPSNIKVEDIKIKEYDANDNTINLEGTIKESMDVIMNEEISGEKEEPVKENISEDFVSYLLEHAKKSDELDKTQLDPSLQMDANGQIEMVVEDEPVDDQIEGQLTIEDMLNAYNERESRLAEEEKIKEMEAAKEEVTAQYESNLEVIEAMMQSAMEELSDEENEYFDEVLRKSEEPEENEEIHQETKDEEEYSEDDFFTKDFMVKEPEEIMEEPEEEPYVNEELSALYAGFGQYKSYDEEEASDETCDDEEESDETYDDEEESDETYDEEVSDETYDEEVSDETCDEEEESDETYDEEEASDETYDEEEAYGSYNEAEDESYDQTEDEESDEAEDAQDELTSKTQSVLKDFLSKYSGMQGIDKQLKEVLNEAIVNKNNKIFIIGDIKSGKTSLGIDLIKVLNRIRQTRGRKIAKISGENLNGKDVSLYFEQTENMDIIVEKSGSINKKTAEEIADVLSQLEDDDKIIIFEDEKTGAETLFNSCEALEKMFVSKIVVKQNKVRDWAEYGRQYASGQGYKIDEMGMLALHAKIDDLYAISIVINNVQVETLINEAIEKSGKKGLGRILKIFGKEKEKVLKEEDF